MSFLTETIEKEISEKKGHIITDNVILSIGEIVNLYKDKDLNLNPDFQRFFRWNNEQKSRLIESIFQVYPFHRFLFMRIITVYGKFLMVCKGLVLYYNTLEN